jgi:tripartite-type tricarboxylate transporter receptor subunit TctC
MQKKLLTLLEEYKQIDLQLSILIKQKDLIKTQIKNRLEEKQLDSFEENGYKATKYEVERVMYIKKELENLVDSKILNRCKKIIKSENIKISYEK